MPIICLFRRLSIVAAAIGLSSCSTNISYDRDTTIAIPAGATVAFAGGTSEGSENLDPAVGNDIVHRRVQSAIIHEIESKGFKLVDDQETADFVLRYFVRVKRSTGQVATTTGMHRTSAWGPGWGMGWGGGVTTVQPVVFSSASFVVDLVERSTGRTAWRGIWQGDPGPRAPTQQEIDSTVARIFRSAPVPG